MTSGFYTTTGRYTTGSYLGVSKAFTRNDETLYAYYCSELAAWVGNIWNAAKGAWVAENVTAEGIIRTCVNNDNFYSSVTSQVVTGTIRSANFATVTAASSGAGTVALTAGTLYGGRLAIVGNALTFTATASSGYAVKRIDATAGGTLVASSTTATLTFTPTADTAVVAYFEPTSYRIQRTVESGGAMVVYRTASGSSTEVDITDDFVNDQYTVYVGDVIRVKCVPNGSYDFSYFRLDETRRYPATSDATPSFAFTIAERASDAVYDFQAVFTPKATYTAYLAVEGGALGTVAVTDDTGTSVPVSSGSFQTQFGRVYTLTATVTTPTLNFFDGWYDANGNRLADAEVLTYTYQQTTVQKSFVAKFAARKTVSVTLVTGTSATTYGTTDAAYLAGCRVTATHPQAVGDKYLSGTWEVTATPATGWERVLLYVEDLDISGNTTTKTFDANGKASVFVSFAARLVAIFRDTSAPIQPADVDQGHATPATGENARGIWQWEGATTRMQATWRSKRYVANVPQNWSAACVYADSYPLALQIDGFQSPESTDAHPSVLSVKSQSGCRIPLRRAEKYAEVEVRSFAQVTHVALSTSMSGLAGGVA